MWAPHVRVTTCIIISPLLSLSPISLSLARWRRGKRGDAAAVAEAGPSATGGRHNLHPLLSLPPLSLSLSLAQQRAKRMGVIISILFSLFLLSLSLSLAWQRARRRRAPQWWAWRQRRARRHGSGHKGGGRCRGGWHGGIDEKNYWIVRYFYALKWM